MRERDVERHLYQQVRRRRGMCIKMIPTVSGLPDRLVLLPGGRTYLVELKAPGKLPEPIQLIRHEQLADIGHPVAVLDTKEGIDQWLQSLSQ